MQSADCKVQNVISCKDVVSRKLKAECRVQIAKCKVQNFFRIQWTIPNLKFKRRELTKNFIFEFQCRILNFKS